MQINGVSFLTLLQVKVISGAPSEIHRSLASIPTSTAAFWFSLTAGATVNKHSDWLVWSLCRDVKCGLILTFNNDNSCCSGFRSDAVRSCANKFTRILFRRTCYNQRWRHCFLRTGRPRPIISASICEQYINNIAKMYWYKFNYRRF